METELLSDLELIASWHNGPLSLREKSMLGQQELAVAREKRRARRKEADKLRAAADLLVREPL